MIPTSIWLVKQQNHKYCRNYLKILVEVIGTKKKGPFEVGNKNDFKKLKQKNWKNKLNKINIKKALSRFHC